MPQSKWKKLAASPKRGEFDAIIWREYLKLSMEVSSVILPDCEGDPTRFFVMHALALAAISGTSDKTPVHEVPLISRGHVSASSLALMCKLPRTTVTRQLKNLEKQGFAVEREEGWTISDARMGTLVDWGQQLMPSLIRFVARSEKARDEASDHSSSSSSSE